MAATRMPAGEVRKRLNRLSALAVDPPGQRACALELLQEHPPAEIVQAAVAVIGRHGAGGGHDVLVATYAALAAAGDPGAVGRVAVLKALRGQALPGDIPMLERALNTYATSPMVTGFTNLRANALLVLDDVAPELASVHAVRLLGEAPPLAEHREQEMSGEPALTAVRLLAAKEELLPLYLFALTNTCDDDDLGGGPIPEVLGEAIRSLAPLPASALGPILALHAGSGEIVVSVSLCELVIDHAPDESLRAFLGRSLTGMPIEAYRYVVAAIVASRRGDLIELLLGAARDEFDRKRLTQLGESLPLVPGPAAAAALAIVSERLAAG
jgi:hypothetical protein